MSEMESAFAKLLGRQPSDSERQNLYRIRDALELENNDALWLVLIALEYYRNEYEKMPQAIAQATNDALAKLSATADRTARSSAEATKAELAHAVAKSARDVAHQVAGKETLQWLAISIATAAISFSLFGWFIHRNGTASGYAAGYGVGYSEARNEQAAASWANTPEGQLAYRFAQSGELQRLARCQGPGWETRDRVCFPRSAKDGVHGWEMP